VQGDVLALCHRPGAIVNLSRGTVLVRNRALCGAHNLVPLEDGTVVVNDTNAHTLRFFELDQGRQIKAVDLADAPWVRSLREGARAAPAAKPLFARGLAVSGDLLFSGMSPAAVVCIDWRTREFLDGFAYTDDVGCCVHGLVVAECRDR